VKLSSVNLKQLMRSYEGTVIMDEALKETLERDLDATKRAGGAPLKVESTKKHTAKGRIRLSKAHWAAFFGCFYIYKRAQFHHQDFGGK
jgi:hypothetical protein